MLNPQFIPQHRQQNLPVKRNGDLPLTRLFNHLTNDFLREILPSQWPYRYQILPSFEPRIVSATLTTSFGVYNPPQKPHSPVGHWARDNWVHAAAIKPPISSAAVNAINPVSPSPGTSVTFLSKSTIKVNPAG